MNAKRISSLVRSCCDVKNCTLMTDGFTGYVSLKKLAEHKTINHQAWYVSGDTNTNKIESFWAILKRGIVGQFHKVSLKHLPKYIHEFCHRYNHRKTGGGVLFNTTIQKGLCVW